MRTVRVMCLVWLASLPLCAQEQPATVHIEVRAEHLPVKDAEIKAEGQTYTTDDCGQATITLSTDSADIIVTARGYAPQTVAVSITPGQEKTVVVELAKVEEEVIVTATRTGRRIEDQATRVEVLDREEVEEKMMMTPGDIVMMLNEMGGLRVQATSPSLGAASVRIQGMRGRYTRLLSDGLPLFGQQGGGLGLLQIPPMDLGQVEVIKGVSSALYGAGALGGVVDLISRRPTKEPAREALVNRTSRGGTDATLFAAQPFTERWSGTVLVGGHWQQRNDIDDDGWADLAGYSRAVVRPRVFWHDGAGRSLFATGGAMWEERRGGTMPDAVLAPTGEPYPESLDTTRFDGGLVAQMPAAGRYVLTARVS